MKQETIRIFTQKKTKSKKKAAVKKIHSRKEHLKSGRKEYKHEIGGLTFKRKT